MYFALCKIRSLSAIASVIALVVCSDYGLANPELLSEGKVSKNRGILEEIVVTAQKRKQGLSEVPVSISAVTSEKLNEAGIEDLIDLSEYTPNFKLVEGGLVPLVYMRGVGSGSNQGFEMSVGMYNDGIHFGRPFQSLAAFLDVERVEVLRGPQSILFGKNAIAGALNITSGKPRDVWEGQVNLSWLEPNSDGEASGYITGPLSGNVQGRLAYRARTEGGYIYNLTQKRDELKLDEQSIRGSIGWQPIDAMDFTLKLEHSNRDQEGRTYQIVDRGILSESANSSVGLDDIRDTNNAEYNSIRSDNATLLGRWDIGGHEVTSVTGVSRYQVTDLFDADNSALESVLIFGVEDYSQFSQEIRWASPVGETFDFIAGVFYQRSEQTYDEVSTLYLRSGTVALAALPAGLADIVALAGPANLIELASGDGVRRFSSDNDALSFFGQFSWQFATDWALTSGLRIVRENKEGSRVLNVYEVGTQNDVDFVSSQIFSQLQVEPHELHRKRRSDSVLPSVNLQYFMNDDVMLYASWSKGAKSGGYDARNNNARGGPTGGGENFEYEDEEAYAFEIGGKLQLLDQTAELNFALFRVDYEDMQISVFDGVASFAVTNAGSARVQGVEMDGRWLIGDSFMLTGALAFLDFEWQNYSNGPCYYGSPEENEDGFCDFAGKENQQTPEWSGSFGGNYTGEINSTMQWKAGVDVNFRDNYYISGDLDPRGENPAYYKINARLSLDAMDGRWSVALVGKNLTNEITTSIGSAVSLDTGSFQAVSDRPRVYGLDLRFKFD